MAIILNQEVSLQSQRKHQQEVALLVYQESYIIPVTLSYTIAQCQFDADAGIHLPDISLEFSQHAVVSFYSVYTDPPLFSCPTMTVATVIAVR